MLCERCGRDVHKHLICNSCNRKICNDCIKSSKRISVTEKAVICKDCWSDLKKRGKYKSAMREVRQIKQFEPRGRY